MPFSQLLSSSLSQLWSYQSVGMPAALSMAGSIFLQSAFYHLPLSHYFCFLSPGHVYYPIIPYTKRKIFSQHDRISSIGEETMVSWILPAVCFTVCFFLFLICYTGLAHKIEPWIKIICLVLLFFGLIFAYIWGVQRMDY